MANYPYRMQLVVDPDNPRNIVAGGTVSIYDAEDTGKTTLLALTDPTGTPIPNPMSSDSQGWTPPFVTTSPEVLWVSGPYTDYFQSYKGMRDEAIAARAAAEAAVAEAAGAKTEAAAAAANAAPVAAAAALADVAARLASGAFQGEQGPPGPAGISNIALDEDGVPYFLAGSNAVQILADTDGQPYFV